MHLFLSRKSYQCIIADELFIRQRSRLGLYVFLYTVMQYANFKSKNLPDLSLNISFHQIPLLFSVAKSFSLCLSMRKLILFFQLLFLSLQGKISLRVSQISFKSFGDILSHHSMSLKQEKMCKIIQQFFFESVSLMWIVE